jgi:hypothetical protein
MDIKMDKGKVIDSIVSPFFNNCKIVINNRDVEAKAAIVITIPKTDVK